jgi:hypothetical protein
MIGMVEEGKSLESKMFKISFMAQLLRSSAISSKLDPTKLPKAEAVLFGAELGSD